MKLRMLMGIQVLHGIWNALSLQPFTQSQGLQLPLDGDEGIVLLFLRYNFEVLS